MSLLPVEEALARILAIVPAPVGVDVPIGQAAGRVLIDPVVAHHDQPPFAASAMDGYAVRAEEVEPGKSIPVVGTSQAGAGYAGPMPQGSAVRIFTGAPMPDGADAVIMQEDAARTGDMVQFSVSVKAGRSVRAKGYDFSNWSVLVPAGVALTPARLALAAAANYASVKVARPPRIALLASGDELVAPGSPLGADQIVSSNSLGLAALFAPYGCQIQDFGIARDTPEALAEALSGAFQFAPDILITTGGASVGDLDLVRPALEAQGVDIDFWRIRMRPGKPLMFGRRGATLVFGLPGNPVSALVTAAVFLRPAVRAFLGLGQQAPRLLPLASATGPAGPRRHFQRARLIDTDRGLSVDPILETDSGHLSSLADADVLLIQPEDDPGQPVGALVPVIPFVGGTL
jgi:molybdopterin molybdotransferase